MCVCVPSTWSHAARCASVRAGLAERLTAYSLPSSRCTTRKTRLKPPSPRSPTCLKHCLCGHGPWVAKHHSTTAAHTCNTVHQIHRFIGAHVQKHGGRRDPPRQAGGSGGCLIRRSVEEWVVVAGRGLHAHGAARGLHGVRCLAGIHILVICGKGVDRPPRCGSCNMPASTARGRLSLGESWAGECNLAMSDWPSSAGVT